MTNLINYPRSALCSLSCTLLVFCLCLSSCSTVNVGTQSSVSSLRAFAGSVVKEGSSIQQPLVAFLTEPATDGALNVRGYMCDGIEGGEIFWVRGPALPNAEGYKFDLTSASGYNIKGTVTPQTVSGTITHEGDTEPREFLAERAGEGEGIFDLNVSADGTIAGHSLTGDSLTLSRSASVSAAADAPAPYEGAITTADGKQIELELVDLSTVDSATLEGAGFATGLATGQHGVEPSSFRAILLKNSAGSTLFGRVLLPGTGVNGVPPQFGVQRVALSSRQSGTL